MFIGDENLVGKGIGSRHRAHIADFEVYDLRAVDPANTSLDIYIGIK